MINRAKLINSLANTNFSTMDVGNQPWPHCRTSIGLRDEPPPGGGGNCISMQFPVPTDRAERSPKGVGSIEFDRRSVSGA